MQEQDDNTHANVDTKNMFAHLFAAEAGESQDRLKARNLLNEHPKTAEELFALSAPGPQEPHIVLKFSCSDSFHQLHHPSSLRSSQLESISTELNEEHEDNFKDKDETQIFKKITKYIENTDKFYMILSKVFEEFEKLTPDAIDEIWRVFLEEKSLKLKERAEYDANYKRIYNTAIRTYETNYHGHEYHYFELDHDEGKTDLDYCYITFTDFIFIFLKILSYFSRFQFCIEFTNFTNYFLIHIWGNDNEFSKFAADQGYELMMKQFGIKYQIAYQKKQAELKSLKQEIVFKPIYDPNEIPLLDENLEVAEDILPLRPKDFDHKIAAHWAPHQKYCEAKKDLFQRYDKSDLHHECPNEDGCQNCSIFRNIDKLRILYDTLDQILKFNILRKSNVLEDMFIMRNFVDYESRLGYKTIVFEPWNVYKKIQQQEFVFLIRNFFNETISYYFLWLINYLQWLICPTIFGIIIYAVLMISGITPDDKLDAGDSFKIVFAGLTVIWGSLFLYQWKEKETFYNYIWGTENFKHFEPDREEFKPEREENIMFGKKFPFSSRTKTLFKFFVSYFVLLIFVLITCGLIIFVFYLKKLVQEEINKSHAEGMPQGLNGWDILGYCLIGLNPCQIKLMNFIYCFIAEKLNKWENHQKEFQKINSNNIKMIMFDFINNYFACFYIIFLKKNLKESIISVDNECYGFGTNKTCIEELEISLYTTLAIFGGFNFLELGLPILMQLYRFRNYKEMEKKNNPSTDVSLINIKRFTLTHLELCDDYNDVSAEYGEMLILYGYVALFGLAAPLVPLIAMILGLIEKFVDSFKLFFLVRVSILDGSTGIEMYKIIMQGFIYIGIITNAAMICFTDKDLSTEKLKATNVSVFIGLVFVYFALSMLARYNALPKWFKYKDEISDLYTSKNSKQEFEEEIQKMIMKEDEKHKEEMKKQKKFSSGIKLS